MKPNVVRLYLQVAIKTTPNGKKQARFTPLPDPLVGYSTSEVSLTAHQYGQEINGFLPAINHIEFIRVILYWTGDFPTEKVYRAVEDKVWFHIKDFVLNDHKFRARVFDTLIGTGWYFENEQIK